MKNQWIIISQIDRQLKEWQAVKNKYAKPRDGWIKTLRLAFGMSAEQLANRLGLTRGRIVQLETAESNETVTLKTLNEAASALGCELVYAIVPKHNGTLQNIIETRAEQVAKEQVARVAHSMSLEAQTVNANTLKTQQEELKRNLQHQINKKLWESSENFNKLAKTIVMQLLKKKKTISAELTVKNNPAFMAVLQKSLLEHGYANNQNDVQFNSNPAYQKALQNALLRYARNVKKQHDPLEKLIKNLNRKK